MENKKKIFGISMWRIFAYFIIYSVMGFFIETVYGFMTKGVLESRRGFLSKRRQCRSGFPCRSPFQRQHAHRGQCRWNPYGQHRRQPVHTKLSKSQFLLLHNVHNRYLLLYLAEAKNEIAFHSIHRAFSPKRQKKYFQSALIWAILEKQPSRKEEIAGG